MSSRGCFERCVRDDISRQGGVVRPMVAGRYFLQPKLGGDIHDAAKMSDVACEIFEGTQRAANRTPRGYSLFESEMQMLVVIYHTAGLANALKAKFFAIHESNGGDREGAAP